MFKQIILSTTVAVAAMAANSAQAASANLVGNGGFETTTMSGNFEFDNNYAAGAGKLTGWSSTGGYNLLFHSNNATTAAGNAAGTWAGTGNEYLWAATASPTGGNFVALDGDPSFTTALTQTIAGLTVGQAYTLSFDWAAAQLHSRTGATTEQLKVSFGTDVYNTNVLSNTSGGFSGWQSVSTTFTAKNTSQVLSFLSIGTPTGLPPVALLDSVSLTAAVPEVSTWTMMIMGFGAVGCAIRRSRTKLAFA